MSEQLTLTWLLEVNGVIAYLYYYYDKAIFTIDPWAAARFISEEAAEEAAQKYFIANAVRPVQHAFAI